jgi:GNAT superfamily N-acetyltransferase
MLNRMEWQVLRLQEEDAKELETLLRAVWSQAYAYPLAWRKKRSLTKKEILSEMRSGVNYFGVKIDGKIVGMYKAIVTYYGLLGEHQSILPKHRGKGLARAMYQQFQQYAREKNCKRVYMNVLAKEGRYKKFVERMGFKPVGKPYEQTRGLLVQMYEREVSK